MGTIHLGSSRTPDWDNLPRSGNVICRHNVMPPNLCSACIDFFELERRIKELIEMKFYVTYNESSARETTEEFSTLKEFFTWLQAYVDAHENQYPPKMRLYEGEPLFEIE